jgi:hypothetical protein
MIVYPVKSSSDFRGKKKMCSLHILKSKDSYVRVTSLSLRLCSDNFAYNRLKLVSLPINAAPLYSDALLKSIGFYRFFTLQKEGVVL